MTFKRGEEALQALNIGIKSKVISVLESIYNDYQNGYPINKLPEMYGDILTPAYIRKIVGSGILLRMTKSKKDMYYKWVAGDNPDFSELADRVMGFSTKSSLPLEKRIDFSKYTSQLTLLLFKNGVDETKISDLTKEIIKIFHPSYKG